MYANRIECYEELRSDWDVRGAPDTEGEGTHTGDVHSIFSPFWERRIFPLTEKIDGLFLLFIIQHHRFFSWEYVIPGTLLFGWDADFSKVLVFCSWLPNTFGNFAPFYQIGMASVLDGATNRLRLLPFLLFNFFINMWYISFDVEAIIDLCYP